MSSSRIPRTIAGFNGYLLTTDDYLQANTVTPPIVPNWERLGLSQPQADQWHAYRQAWEQTLYPKYLNPNTKTKTVNKEVAEGMAIFSTFAQPLLNIMAANPEATQEDANIFNFKIGRKSPSHPTQPISLQPLVGLVSLGGAMVKFACRTQQDSSRPSLPQEADCVMIAYKIGEAVPVSPNDGTEMMIASRASDKKDFGIENRGKRLHMFVRYYNTHYPEFAGPWSEMTSVSL